MIMSDNEHWHDKEVADIDFGDKRLNKRITTLMNSFSDSPSESIPKLSKGWKETIAAYRFFNNKNITADRILSSHKKSTLERIKSEELVLIAQDTTEICFTGRKKIKGIGYLNSQTSHGFFFHSSIAMTPNKLCLGTIGFESWTRENLGVRHERANKSVEEKESYNWLKGYEKANEVAKEAPNTTVVNIMDRAGDIYEILEKVPSEENKAYWIIRSSRNRKIKRKDNKKMWEEVKSKKPIGTMKFELPSGNIYKRSILSERASRKERTVSQEIRVAQVCLAPPQRNKGKKLTPVTINIVHCIETNPPSEEDRIEWFLLTSIPIENYRIAFNVVKFYLCRWQIEIFFKILKSGCTVEKLQFESFQSIINCIALYMIISWRILYITNLSRVYPDIKCNIIFEDNEWKSICAVATKKPPPNEPPKLKEIVVWIAQLGGFLNRKSDNNPGVKTIWIGIQRMRDFALLWETVNSKNYTCV